MVFFKSLCAYADAGIPAYVVSYLHCHSLLSLAASSTRMKLSGLEWGLNNVICGGDFATERRIQGFVRFVQKCQSLLYVDMEYPYCKQLPDIVVTSIAETCKNLRSLVINNDIYADEPTADAAIQVIAQSCKELVHIEIADTDVTDDGAQLLAASCPKLEFVSIGGTGITELGAAALAERCALAQASADMQGRARGPQLWKGINLYLYRLDDVDVESLRRRFPDIWICF